MRLLQVELDMKGKEIQKMISESTSNVSSGYSEQHMNLLYEIVPSKNSTLLYYNEIVSFSWKCNLRCSDLDSDTLSIGSLLLHTRTEIKHWASCKKQSYKQMYSPRGMYKCFKTTIWH